MSFDCSATRRLIPCPGAQGVTEKDARYVVKFLRVLLLLLQDLPDDIKEFRDKNK
jgi:hypothetical protein